MKNILTYFLLFFVISLCGCSKAPRFLLLNNSTDPIGLIVNGAKSELLPGQWTELAFDPHLKVLWRGREREYMWIYPNPASDFMEFGSPTERFAVSLESDGAVYARLISNGRPTQTIPPQPKGFPLKGRSESEDKA